MYEDKRMDFVQYAALVQKEKGGLRLPFKDTLSVALCVVIVNEQIHGLKEPMGVDERSDNYESAEDAPEPERLGAEFVAETSPGELAAYTVGDPVLPYQCAYAESDRCDQENKQTVVHRFLTVMRRSDCVDAFRRAAVNNDGVDAERDDRQQDQLQKAGERLELVVVSFHFSLHLLLTRADCIYYTFLKGFCQYVNDFG